MRIGVTGHRNLGDAAGREAIRTKLEEILCEYARPGDEALSGLAIGADQIFAEVALAGALRLHAVLACKDYETTFAPREELHGYKAQLAKASEVTTMPFSAPSEAAFEAAGRWIVEHCDMMLAVWDGKPAKGRGGTGDIVAYARSRGTPVIVIPAP